MNTLLLKRCIGRCCSALKFYPRNRKVILVYHAVGDGPWAISTDQFIQQIQWLSKYCYIQPLNKLLNSMDSEKNIEVAITFDDGYACLYEIVLPILQSINAVATVYINTGWMSDCENTRKISNPELGYYPGERFLTWHEVQALDHAGWEIGSHGVEHLDLTKSDDEVIDKELCYSKKTIEKQLKKKCNHFCYTWGRNTKKLQKLVVDAGYQYAVSARHGSVCSKKNSAMSLPRINIAKEYDTNDFIRIVTGHWDFLKSIQFVKDLL